MGSDNQGHQNTITSETQTSTYNTNTNEPEQFNEKQEIINDNVEHPTNQLMLDRPVTVSDILEGKVKVTLPPKKQGEPTVIPESNNKSNNNALTEKKVPQRLSTTDSMQEFLEIPDNLPNDFGGGDDDEDGK